MKRKKGERKEKKRKKCKKKSTFLVWDSWILDIDALLVTLLKNERWEFKGVPLRFGEFGEGIFWAEDEEVDEEIEEVGDWGIFCCWIEFWIEFWMMGKSSIIFWYFGALGVPGSDWLGGFFTSNLFQ